MPFTGGILRLPGNTAPSTNCIPNGSIMLNAGKGIEIGTWRRPSAILRESIPQASSCGSIMGPNIAFEVALDKYAEAVIALDSHADSVRASGAFCTPNPPTTSWASKSGRPSKT